MNNCSRCGASNPETNKFCGSCGQPLVAVAPPPSASPSEDIPEWLRSTDDPPSAAVASTNTSNPAASELPTWLSDIGVEDNQTQSAPAPDWLAQLQQSPSPGPTSESDNDLPEWLREDVPAQQSADNAAGAAPAWPSVSGGYSATSDDNADALPSWLQSGDIAPAPTPGAAASTNGELPDWLQSNDVAPVTSSSNASDDLPEWMRSDVADAVPLPATASNELPPWLQSDELPTSPQAATNVADTVPNWLHDAQPGQSAQPAAHASSDLPSWLDPADLDGTQPAATTAHSGASDELPAWLRDDDIATQSTPTLNNDSVNPLGAAAGDELPAWMQTNETLPSSSSQQVNDLPPWLADASETPTPAQSGALAAPEVGSLPGWLLDESASDAAGSQGHHAAVYDTSSSDVPSWLNETPSNDGSASDVDVPVPNWASEFGEAPSATAPSQIGLQDSEELPSWLNDASSSAPPPAAQAPDASDGLPAWLMEESPTTVPPTAATQPFASVNSQTSSSDELPSWLSDDTAGFASTSNARADADTQELPSWLSDSALATGSVTPSRPNADDPGMTQELPSWLLDQPVDATSAPVASGSDATNDALPPWLQTADEPFNAQAAPGQAPGTDAAANDALPPWLQTADEPTPPSSEGLPSWLGLPDEPASDQHTTQMYDSGSSEGLPAWLSGDEPTATDNTAQIYDGVEASTSPATANTSVNNTGVDLPSWLNEADATAAPTDSASDLPPWLSGMPDQSSTQANSGSALPSWLDEPEQTGTEKADAGQSELLGGLDLPAWLRDESAPRPAAPAPEAAPNWLQRVTPEVEEHIVPVVVEDVPPRPRVVRTPERVAAANMLQQLIAEPVAEPIPQVMKRRRSPVLTIVLALIALLIIGALLAILLNGRFGLNFGAAPVTSPMVVTAAQTIAGLPSNRPVVLAYEWDAQRLGDLRPLEEVVVGQLATRTDVPLIFVSTDPQGALLASERTIQISSLKDNFHDQYGLGYVHLGFKAGGPLALRRFAANSAFGALFAQDVSGIDLRANDVTMTSMCGGATSDSCSWDNVSLLVVMADDANDVRGWFEQVRSEHPDLQTLLLTSAEIGPEVQPYAATPNVSMLAGLRDAEMYAQAIGSPSERIGRQMDATAVGGALFAAAVVAGGIPAVITGRRARRIDCDDRVR